jgi:hypothetical protein
MIDGTVTEDWARTHHPAWYRATTSSHKEAQKAQEFSLWLLWPTATRKTTLALSRPEAQNILL